MKIVHYMAAIRLEDGGVTRAVIDLCNIQAARRHDVIVLTKDTTDVPTPWLSESTHVPKVMSPRITTVPYSRMARRGFVAVAQCLKNTDILHLHVPWDPICLQLGKIAQSMNLPYVVSIHGMLDEWTIKHRYLKKRLYLMLGGRKLLENAVAVHCTGAIEAQQSERWYPSGRSAVIPLIFDLSDFQNLPGPQLTLERYPQVSRVSCSVLFMGRLHPIKRLELLIESIALLKQRGMDVILVIAGSGEREYVTRLKELTKSLNVTDDVIFPGFVSGEIKLSLYQSADVFVLPSYHENWGFVSIESLACGTPVVTTRDVNIWQELQSGGGAEIVEATAQHFANAIADIASDKDKRSLMSRRGRSWVHDTFNVDEIAHQYEQIYAKQIT